MNHRAKILVVEDEPNVRLVFRTALECAGYVVDETVDGESALRKLEASDADVVLLDLLMPDVSGMEVLRQLRERGNDVPVVIVTAHGSIPDAVAAMKLGAVDFLTKPLSPETLRRVVREVTLRHATEDREPEATRDAPRVQVTIAPAVVNLGPVKRAINRRELDHAALLLERALDLAPHSAEALTLMGVLHECRGQDHAAYHSYKEALESDPHYAPALDNLKRYCQRFGLDSGSKPINPAAGAEPAPDPATHSL